MANVTIPEMTGGDEPSATARSDHRDYTALIRTGVCDDRLRLVVDALHAQTLPPVEILFVDSSKSEVCAAGLAKLGRVIPYTGPWNPARALNLGFNAVHTPWTLMISSHTVLRDLKLIEYGVAKANANAIDLIYWSPPAPAVAHKGLQCNVIDRRRFNGRNGMSASCGMIPTAMVRERPFDTTPIFSEDQVWVSHYIRAGGQSLGVISTSVDYENASLVDPMLADRRLIGQGIAIAYFANPRSMLFEASFGRVLRAATALVRGRRRRAVIHAAVALGVIKSIFRAPKLAKYRTLSERQQAIVKRTQRH